MTVHWVAIDPGRSGAVVLKRNGELRIESMPDSDQELALFLKRISEPDTQTILGLEEPPRFTGNRIPGSRIAVLFQNFGVILGVAVALEWNIRIYSPKQWQKPFGLGSSVGLTRSEWKRKLKAKAIELYPGTQVTNDNADALLILHHLQCEPMALAGGNDRGHRTSP